MFDNILRELDRLSRPFDFKVPVASDAHGYMDRECPGGECGYLFKVLAEDWRAIFTDEGVSCPRCGHKAPAREWNTSAQIEHQKKLALGHVEGRIGDALKRDAGSKSSTTNLGGLLDIKMSMTYSGPSGPGLVIPAPAREELEQRLRCPACKARYAVLGSAFFCPSCGRNSVEEIFDSTVEKLLSGMDSLGSIRTAIANVDGKDDADRVCTTIIEASLQECVTAFQALCEGLYQRVCPTEPAPRNVFQRLDQGSGIWERVLGLPYSDVLSSAELARLRVLFQRRHLLAHTQGLVNEVYLRKSGDSAYVVGQRIVVSQDDVRSLAGSIRKLGAAIRTGVSERPNGNGEQV